MTKRKRTEGKATQWPKEKDRRTSKTMAKRKGTEGQETIVLLVLLSFSFGHGIACPSVIFFWALCWLSFCPFYLAIVLFFLLSLSFWSKEQKDKQHNGQTKEGGRTSNTMTKRKGQKDKQHNDQNKRSE
jgi:hypothetical protein